MSQRCGSCEAPIVWAFSPAGKRSPINESADPEKGKVMLIRPSGLSHVLAVTLGGEILDFARAQRLPLHVSHWATCVDRKQWRERTDAKAAGNA